MKSTIDSQHSTCQMCPPLFKCIIRSHLPLAIHLADDGSQLPKHSVFSCVLLLVKCLITQPNLTRPSATNQLSSVPHHQHGHTLHYPHPPGVSYDMSPQRQGGPIAFSVTGAPSSTCTSFCVGK